MLQMLKSTAADLLQEDELVTDLLQGWVPLIAAVIFLVCNKEVRLGRSLLEDVPNFLNKAVGNEADECPNRDAHEAKEYRETPSGDTDWGHRERTSTEEDDQNLAANN